MKTTELRKNVAFCGLEKPKFSITNSKKNNSTKKVITLLLFTLILMLTGCYPILQSAELAPPKKFTHTIRTGAFIDDYFITDDIFPQGIGYHIAYGLNDHLELNSDLDLFWPRTSLGAKIKLMKKLSFSTNINASFYEDVFYYPDFTLIYGHKTYCGVRTSLIIDNMSQIFIGKKIRAFSRYNLIPEVSLNFSGYLNLGLGFEF